MGLSHSGVDLLPVEMFLIDDGLHTLRENSKLQTEILDCCALQVGTIDRLFGEWGQTTDNSHLRVVPRLEQFCFLGHVLDGVMEVEGFSRVVVLLI